MMEVRCILINPKPVAPTFLPVMVAIASLRIEAEVEVPFVNIQKTKILQVVIVKLGTFEG